MSICVLSRLKLTYRHRWLNKEWIFLKFLYVKKRHCIIYPKKKKTSLHKINDFSVARAHNTNKIIIIFEEPELDQAWHWLSISNQHTCFSQGSRRVEPSHLYTELIHSFISTIEHTHTRSRPSFLIVSLKIIPCWSLSLINKTKTTFQATSDLLLWPLNFSPFHSSI